MKHTILASLCVIIISCSRTPSNQPTSTASSYQSLVAMIRPDMPTEELSKLFGVKGQLGPWSGGTGYYEYLLPSGQKISVSCYSHDGLMSSFVNPDVAVYIQDKPGEQMKKIR